MLVGSLRAQRKRALARQDQVEIDHPRRSRIGGRVRAIVRDVEWAGNEIMRYLLTEYRGIQPADEAVIPVAETVKK